MLDNLTRTRLVEKTGVAGGQRWWRRALLASVLACAGWAATVMWRDVMAAGTDVTHALWTVPLIVALHVVQLLLSAGGWRGLFGSVRPGFATVFRLRFIREGVNSLLPVAHVGGEVVAVQLLAQHGIPAARGTASIVVDVTMEVCAQFVFLLAGCLVLGCLSGAAPAWLWLGSVITAVMAAIGLLLVQHFGGLRLLAAAVREIGRRWPNLTVADLDGLHAEVRALYRQPRRLLTAFLLQSVSWVLGVGESWIVLHALGVGASPAQVFVVESLGAAARSAGFAVPGALAVQEGGFVLAAAAVGLPAMPSLSLSLIKRVREVIVGVTGLVCWRLSRSVSPHLRTPMPFDESD